MKTILHTPLNLRTANLKESLQNMVREMKKDANETTHIHGLMMIDDVNVDVRVVHAPKHGCGLFIDVRSQDDPLGDAYAFIPYESPEDITIEEISETLNYTHEILTESSQDSDVEKLALEIIEKVIPRLES